MALEIESHKSNFDKEKDRRQYYMEQQERFHYLICQANIQKSLNHFTIYKPATLRFHLIN